MLVEGIIACPVPLHGGRPRSRRRSAPSMVNAIRTGSRTATAIATEIGTPGWVLWNCASPRSEWAATSLRQRRTAVRATQRDSAAGGDPAGPCGRGIHHEDGQSDIGTCNFGELGLLQHLSGLQGCRLTSGTCTDLNCWNDVLG